MNYDTPISLISGIVDTLRNESTISTESYDSATGKLTLEVIDSFELKLNEFIQIGGVNYQIIGFVAAAPPALAQITIKTGGVLGETSFKVPYPYFFHGTYQMVEKQISSLHQNLKLPAIFLFYNIEEERDLDNVSALSRSEKIQMAFLGESHVDFQGDRHEEIIKQQDELVEKFLYQLQENQFVAKMDTARKVFMANFGVFIRTKGELRQLLKIQSSGVLLDFNLPLYTSYDQCKIDNFEFYKCAPGLIKDDQGNLIQTLGPSETYIVQSGGGGDVRIEDSASNLIGNQSAPGTFVVNDSLVTNSNGSYSQSVRATQPLSIPDIEFTDSDGSSSFVPSVEDLVCTPAVSPSGIAYDRPKTPSMVSSIFTGDAADHISRGTYDYTPPAYPLSFAKLDRSQGANMFFLLVENNSFGHKFRFTGSSGGYYDIITSDFKDSSGVVTTKALSFPNDYVIDNLTGLGYYTIIRTAISDLSGEAATVDALSLSGFNDWRICLPSEYCSIFWDDNGVLGTASTGGLDYEPFIDSSLNITLWTNLISAKNTNIAYEFRFRVNANYDLAITGRTRTVVQDYYIVRNHF